MTSNSYHRTVICGTSGAGKSTLAKQASERLDVRYTELDSLYHGPNWTPRASFLDEVNELADTESWIIEWQYRAATHHTQPPRDHHLAFAIRSTAVAAITHAGRTADANPRLIAST